MHLKQLKLDLINAISRCQDPKLLNTLAQVMELDQEKPESSAPKGSQEELPWDIPDADAADELQQSIDDIFHP